MSGAADIKYKCSLSGETLEKAKKELNEDPETRVYEVKNLRARLEKVPGLQPRTDINFLLLFLRARKFEQERAFLQLKNYYETRRDSSDLFDDLKPSRVKHVMEDGLFEVLKERDNMGCRVVIMRPAKWDPDRYPMTEMLKANFLLLSKLIEDEETQVNGVHLINNLEGVSFKQASHITPSMAKRMMHIMQDVVPLRLKRLDYVNEPAFFDVVYAIIRQFMKEKLTKRIVLNGSKFDKLHESISPDFLPKDLGGKLEPYSNKEWMDNFLASDSKFVENNKFGFVNMALNSEKSSNKSVDAGIAGLGGTFKKLDI